MVEGKATVREHLAQAESAGAKVPALHPDPPPPELEYLWRWFQEMFTAAKPLDFAEIRAWCELTGAVLMPWEVAMMRRLSDRFHSVFADHQRKVAES